MNQVFTPTYQGSQDSRKPGKFWIIITGTAIGIVAALLTLLLSAMVIMKWVQATPAPIDCGNVGIMCGSGK